MNENRFDTDQTMTDQTAVFASALEAPDAEEQEKRRLLPIVLWGAMGAGIALAAALELGAPVAGIADAARAVTEPAIATAEAQKEEGEAEKKDPSGSKAGANAVAGDEKNGKKDEDEKAEEAAGAEGAQEETAPDQGKSPEAAAGSAGSPGSGSKPASGSSSSSSSSGKPAGSSSSSSSSGSRPSSGSSSSGGSSSSSGSSGTTSKPQRRWVVDVPGHYERRKTGTREVVSGQRWVVDQAAWDEEVWDTRWYWRVSDGSVFATEAEAGNYMKNKLINEGISLSYGQRSEDYISGYIHHDEVGHWEKTYKLEDVYTDVWVDEVGHWE